MWKTTDRYVQQKRVKAVEAESKLKQVYIPNYNNNKQAINGGVENLPANGKPCECCSSKLFYDDNKHFKLMVIHRNNLYTMV